MRKQNLEIHKCVSGQHLESQRMSKLNMSHLILGS